jgi:hypothetical protein
MDMAVERLYHFDGHTDKSVLDSANLISGIQKAKLRRVLYVDKEGYNPMMLGLCSILQMREVWVVSDGWLVRHTFSE